MHIKLLSLHSPRSVRAPGPGRRVGVKERLQAKFGVRQMALFWLIYLSHLGMSLNFSKPQFPHLEIYCQIHKVFVRIKRD